MTGDHVQDLLLDLAYGELPADRAAEVEAHLATCEACRAERDGLVRTRALVAPLRSLEEPSARFDERIVHSARAEAGLQADGTPGPTIEVSGSVKPLGLQAGRVDPLAPGVRVSKKEINKRSLWLRRATVGASIAGAAAVALFVASSVQQKRVDRADEVPELKVRAPGVAVPPSAPEPAQGKVPQERKTAPPATAAQPQGSGGDLAALPPPAPPPAARLEQQRSPAAKKTDRPALPAPTVLKDEMDKVPDATRAAAADRLSSTPPREKAEAETRAEPTERQSREAQAGRQIAIVPAPRRETGVAKAAAGADLDPDRLEESAGDARREGGYVRAAELYQLAAGLRRAKNDSSRAAWDLAHAVECLAAASKLGEAGDVRGELMRSYPSEESPLRAADRALGWPAKARR